jgi:transcriptional regulator with XRE-family HTH domain
MERDRLEALIQNASSITEVLQMVDRDGCLTPLKDVLTDTMAEHQYTPQELSKRIDVERSTLYRLISGERLTTRNVLLRIALALRLSLADTQAMLRSGQRAELYAPVRRDAVIIFCITHGMTMAQAEEMLLRKGEGSLFERV